MIAVPFWPIQQNPSVHGKRRRMAVRRGLSACFYQLVYGGSLYCVGKKEKGKDMDTVSDMILVDLDDREIGQGEKLEVHRRGQLHRAFSVFLFDKDRLLIQKRADGKYHSAGLWANTCCSHPRTGQTLTEAAGKRLWLECGIANVPLKEAGSFVYRAVFSDGLIEYEVDHVFVGAYAGSFKANPEEISELRYVPMDLLKQDMLTSPEHYAPWFFTALGIAEAFWKRCAG